MQIDFHYNTIRVITEKVGFSAEEAQIIAYASQYIDDAVDHESIIVKGSLDILHHRFSGKSFNPVCTAHRGLQFIKGLKEEVQNKIYIPFHFLTNFNKIKSKKESFIVKPDNLFARNLVLNSINKLAKSRGEARILNLIRLGIALHTYADTWAHQEFSGRHNSKENDIENIELLEQGKWKKISMINQLEYNIFPDIGHAEAASFPDQSHLKWRYIKASTNGQIERDNTSLFMQAAQKTYELLTGLYSKRTFKSIENRILECFLFVTDSLDEKFQKFQEVFPEIGFYYNSTQWKEEAIRVAETSKIEEAISNKQHYILGSDKKWFYFHLAALDQRMHVLKVIPKS